MLPWVLFTLFLIPWSPAVTASLKDETLEKTHSGTLDQRLIMQLVESVAALKAQNSKQQEFMEEMHETLIYQGQEMNRMKTQLNSYERLFNMLSTRPVDYASSNNGVKGMKKVNTQDQPKHDKITRDQYNAAHDPGSGHQRDTRQADGTPIAFSAVATDSVNHYGAANQNIRFEQVDVNSGNAYDPNTGVFTAPYAGIYIISVSILSVADREASCDIIVNGNARGRLYARGSNGRHDQGSQTVLYRLDKGDVVSVQNEAADDAVHGGMYTTFSGFLLPEETPVTSVIG